MSYNPDLQLFDLKKDEQSYYHQRNSIRIITTYHSDRTSQDFMLAEYICL
ncbi:hypothetical protein QE450_000286 [Paenibacillus sp. SORGH_AS306]|uniref:Uncharacterized protein n=1 Tax=Paenibacillus kyungheensis TaxID=1452732 RepID=A0AAX3M4R0_9BACL|nr:hypothetical protein [Paenibacillus kyungheensis]MDQ1232788.1 hypothetical protein [Paenibacillus sp. SORGH_AS_0306]MDR6109835.1 hypothetical protein [Paenibacillus sp. SORGH_AS_0338]WCT56823.1 hypothetical protein PQ456_04670 [Paenibacillus kyungheensis]